MLPACLLAIVAGYADTVGYLRYDAFAGLMTGNTILLGIDVANGGAPSAAFHGGIIAVFLAGVIASRVPTRPNDAAMLGEMRGESRPLRVSHARRRRHGEGRPFIKGDAMSRKLFLCGSSDIVTDR